MVPVVVTAAVEFARVGFAVTPASTPPPIAS